MRQKLDITLGPRPATETDRLGFKVEAGIETTIYVEGVVGDGWSGLDSETLVKKIKNTDTPIRLRLKTPGGSYFDAIDVHAALIEHPHSVIADITGQAESAGTILAAAADKIRIHSGASWMIHRAMNGFLIFGNEAEQEATLDWQAANRDTLRKVDEAIAGVIATRTGNTVEEVRNWMVFGPEHDGGTRFIGQEAVDKGVVDELIDKPTTARAPTRDIDNREMIQQANWYGKVRANAVWTQRKILDKILRRTQ